MRRLPEDLPVPFNPKLLFLFGHIVCTLITCIAPWFARVRSFFPGIFLHFVRYRLDPEVSTAAFTGSEEVLVSLLKARSCSVLTATFNEGAYSGRGG